MSGKRHSSLRKATALVPLAVLSAAWTVHATGLGGTTALASSSDPTSSTGRGVLPDGTPLPPPIGLNHPASVSGPQAQKISDAQASQLVSSASTSGIPAVALAAYQHAASVMNSADPGCRIPWQLIAAIGRVESDHGRADGNTLTSKGISTPGIFGPVLNGQNGTALIRDTDGGVYDGNTQFDRAVGPMQFIPSTWAIVAVDADGDGKRNPQDINDAALGAAVYLCSGTTDLAGTSGAREAVYRYNHSWSYVSTVLGVERAYMAGDYTSVPNSTLAPEPIFQPVTGPSYQPRHAAHTSTPTSTTASGSSPKTSAPKHRATPPSTTTPTTPTKPKAPSTPPVTAPIQKPVTDAAATLAQVTNACTTALKNTYPSLQSSSNAAVLSKAVTQCVAKLDGKTEAQVQAQVQGVVNNLSSVIQNLLGGIVGGLTGGLGG